jgi:hypothetical protein
MGRRPDLRNAPGTILTHPTWSIATSFQVWLIGASMANIIRRSFDVLLKVISKQFSQLLRGLVVGGWIVPSVSRDQYFGIYIGATARARCWGK